MSNRDLLLRILDGASERKAWHGTNLRGSLRAAIEKATPQQLTKLERLIYGVAAHDAYHTGQIQLIKRLRGRDGPRGQSKA
jgi:hypothetical protein